MDKTWLPNKTQNTVYGVWEKNTYQLTWDANGGQSTTTTSAKYEDEIKAPASEPKREGYTFGGWFQDKNCSVPLTAGTKVKNNQTFYAKWTAEKVKVSYYDTRQGTALVETQTYDYGDGFSVLDPLQDTDGWTFVRWETRDGQDAATIDKLDSAVLTYHAGGNGADVASDAGYWTLDIYAVWAQKTVDFTATVWRGTSSTSTTPRRWAA